MGVRLDTWLVENSGFVSRERARRAIESNCVSVNGIIRIKPSFQVGTEDTIIAIDPLKFVSAGGLKLEKAIHDFGLDFSEKKVLDIGASTGGFTDCALQYGASLVYTVDVGSAQLHPSLASHPKVHSMENKDFRSLQPADVNHLLFDLILIDVSFISLEHIIPGLKNFLSTNGQVIALIKPQFEAGKQRIGKRGIVKEKQIHVEVIEKIISIASSNQLFISSLTHAPLFREKNIEYLCLFTISPQDFLQVGTCVEKAFVLHSQLK